MKHQSILSLLVALVLMVAPWSVIGESLGVSKEGVVGQTPTNSTAKESKFSSRIRAPLGKITPDQKKDHGSNDQQRVNDLSIRPPHKSDDAPSVRSSQQYPMSYLNTLSHAELIQLLSSISWDQIPDLFQFNQDSYHFYRDSSRVQAIINALEQKGRQFTSENHLGIPTLVEVLRSGFFLGYYYQELDYLNQRDFHDRCLPALKSIAGNSAFVLGTSTQDQVVSAYGKLIGNASSDVETVNYATSILKQFRDNMDVYLPEYTKGSAVYDLMSGIEYDLDSYVNRSAQPPNKTPWYGKVDSFIEEVGKYALLENMNKDNVWLVNNGIYYVSSLGRFHTQTNRGNQVITQAMKKFPRLSEPYLTAAIQIHERYNGVNADGLKINIDQIKNDAKQYYLPQTYTFDNGSIVFKTGRQVTKEKVLRLYWASKEVKAQFHRVMGKDTEIEKGNPDDVLTVIIYSNPDEYKLNRLLYGFSTNNGGIYIESLGTFFTYERTPTQSVYSLEELFRHEVTHYLQGRYLIPGMFGEGPFYEGERLTWFEEGSAELFAGSTRTSGIQPRKTIVKQLAKNPSDRYTVTQTLHAKYGSWDFYNYAFAFQSYMYHEYYPMLDYLNNSILQQNVSAYDRYINQMSQDQNLNTIYQHYMQSLIDKVDQWPIPHVSDIYLARHPYIARSKIYNKIKAVGGLSNVIIKTNQSVNVKTFTLRGRYTGQASQGKYKDWTQMNQRLDQMLNQLSKESWSGYKTVTAYFVNYRVNGNGQAVYDVVFHGILTD